jgi:hypothetical protein
MNDREISFEYPSADLKTKRPTRERYAVIVSAPETLPPYPQPKAPHNPTVDEEKAHAEFEVKHAADLQDFRSRLHAARLAVAAHRKHHKIATAVQEVEIAPPKVQTPAAVAETTIDVSVDHSA